MPFSNSVLSITVRFQNSTAKNLFLNFCNILFRFQSFANIFDLTGQEGGGTGGNKDKREAGQEGGMRRGRHDRREAGQEGGMTGGRQDRREA